MVYSSRMDRDWMREKLESYLAGNIASLEAHFANDYTLRDEIDGNLRRQERTVKEILKRLDPKLADFDLMDSNSGSFVARMNVELGLGIVQDRGEWAVRLAPDSPALPADQFHPWVWESARSLWSTGHYRQAVQSTATAINAHTQTKLGRRDLSDTKLMQSAFSTSPKPGVTRLVVDTTGLSGDTAAGLQTGALSFAVGCFQAIRNPATHEHGDDWDEQRALEYLGAFSVLARWIDAATVETP